ncbi:dCTP deaminase [Pseudomonas phage Zuri]|uniref:Metallopeptidase n=1 Tax=Pseudomonas phage Zuri TaxID=2604899 RepID=A0A5C1K5X2_9CAUD|nr:dCTP deaminase [Pseudomonas phage Zuri]QEM41142.1 metallopeptidase [Pseudomonas phage Zuri]
MVINGLELVVKAPIQNMSATKNADHGTSWGLSEAGYDIRIKQTVSFRKFLGLFPQVKVGWAGKWKFGRFALASAEELFQMPNDVLGIVHDKSTWARRTLSVFNTVIEPGWKGYLTLELVFHGSKPVHIPAGSGIAQVIFHGLSNRASYNGKYQNQEDRPVAARESA